MPLFSFGPSDSQRRAREAKRRARLAAQWRRRELLRASLALLVLLAILLSLYSMAVLIRKPSRVDIVRYGSRHSDDGLVSSVGKLPRAASIDGIEQAAENRNDLKKSGDNETGVNFINPVNAADIVNEGASGSGSVFGGNENVGRAEAVVRNANDIDEASGVADRTTPRTKGYPNDNSDTSSDTFSFGSSGKYYDQKQVPVREQRLAFTRENAKVWTNAQAGNLELEQQKPQDNSLGETGGRTYQVDTGLAVNERLDRQAQTRKLEQGTGAESVADDGREAHEADALDEEEGGQAPIIALAKRGDPVPRDETDGMVVVRDAGPPQQRD